jgi:hypothetical protein
VLPREPTGTHAITRRLVTEWKAALAVTAMLNMLGLCGADIELSAGMVARRH